MVGTLLRNLEMGVYKNFFAPPDTTINGTFYTKMGLVDFIL